MCVRLISEGMCARARCSICREEAAKKVDVPEEQWKDVEKFEPKYNIQPGYNALVVVKDGEVTLLNATSQIIRHIS